MRRIDWSKYEGFLQPETIRFLSGMSSEPEQEKPKGRREPSVGVTDERINQGAPTNIPLLVPGQVGVEDLLAGKDPTNEQLHTAIEYASQMAQKGAEFPPFDAEQHARELEERRQGLPPTPEEEMARLEQMVLERKAEQSVAEQRYAERPGIPNQAVRGFARGLTADIMEPGKPSVTWPETIAEGLGGLAGGYLPFSRGMQLGNWMLRGIKNPLARSLIAESLTGAGYMGVAGRGDPTEIALGAVAPVALHGAGRAWKALRRGELPKTPAEMAGGPPPLGERTTTFRGEGPAGFPQGTRFRGAGPAGFAERELQQAWEQGGTRFRGAGPAGFPPRPGFKPEGPTLGSDYWRRNLDKLSAKPSRIQAEILATERPPNAKPITFLDEGLPPPQTPEELGIRIAQAERATAKQIVVEKLSTPLAAEYEREVGPVNRITEEVTAGRSQTLSLRDEMTADLLGEVPISEAPIVEAPVVKPKRTRVSKKKTVVPPSAVAPAREIPPQVDHFKTFEDIANSEGLDWQVLKSVLLKTKDRSILLREMGFPEEKIEPLIDALRKMAPEDVGKVSMPAVEEPVGLPETPAEIGRSGYPKVRYGQKPPSSTYEVMKPNTAGAYPVPLFDEIADKAIPVARLEEMFRFSPFSEYNQMLRAGYVEVRNGNNHLTRAGYAYLRNNYPDFYVPLDAKIPGLDTDWKVSRDVMESVSRQGSPYINISQAEINAAFAPLSMDAESARTAGFVREVIDTSKPGPIAYQLTPAGAKKLVFGNRAIRAQREAVGLLVPEGDIMGRQAFIAKREAFKIESNTAAAREIVDEWVKTQNAVSNSNMEC